VAPFAFGLLGSLFPIALLALLVIVVLSGRHEPDPTRERPQAIYLAAACFVGLVTLLAALVVVVVALVGLTGNGHWSSYPSYSESRSAEVPASPPDGFAGDGNAPSFGSPPRFGNGANAPSPFLRRVPPRSGPSWEQLARPSRQGQRNRDIAMAVRGAIVAVLALGLLVFHDPKLTRVVAASPGPAARVGAKYLYLVCFVTALIMLGAGTVALFSVFAAAAPGVAGVASRANALRHVASAGVLAAGAALVFVRHWRRSTMLADGPIVVAEPTTKPETLSSSSE